MSCQQRATSRCHPGLVVLLLGTASASFVRRPFRDYASSPAPAGSEPGVRRFYHHELHPVDETTDAELQWEVDVDPDTILALDLEHEKGVRVLACSPNQLVLQVTSEHFQSAERWRHVTASSHVHGCKHLKERNLYHRVLKLNKRDRTAAVPMGFHHVNLDTEELASSAHVFPYCSYAFNLVPAGPRRQLPLLLSSERRLAGLAHTSYKSGSAAVQNSFVPDVQNEANGKSIFNWDVPREIKDLVWRWNYELNTTKNPQFKYSFPGGYGAIRFYQPYLLAHFLMRLNYTSKFNNIRQAPHVVIDSELNGTMDFKFDIDTGVHFNRDRSASVIDNVLDRIDILGLANLTHGQLSLKPLTFDMGGTPFMIKPQFNCGLKAYHRGKLAGTLRVGLQALMLVDGRAKFDSHAGLPSANFSVKVTHINITTPKFLLYTKRFELGMMLEPEMCLSGGFDEVSDMSMCVVLRPYFNLSISQNGTGTGADELPETIEQAPLAIYPFRAYGLPKGKNYVVRILANGMSRNTSNQMSTGVVEWCDNPSNFDFGEIREVDLISNNITVQLLEDGKEPPVATGTAVCKKLVNGVCYPKPTATRMELEGKLVFVELNIIWQDGAINRLRGKIQGISLRVPSVNIIGEEVPAQLEDPKVLEGARLRLIRNGHTYSMGLAKHMNQTIILKGTMIYEMGTNFLGSWKFYVASNSRNLGPAEQLVPKLELVVGGKVVASGTMPPVPWDTLARFDTLDDVSRSIKEQVIPVPVMVPLYANGQMFGSCRLELDVLPPGKAAFWVSPAGAEEFPAGHTETFAWAVHGGKEQVDYDFTLIASQVAADASLTPTGWEVPIKAQCKRGGSDVQVLAYTAGRIPCVFTYQVQIPGSLAGKKVVMTVSWEDAGGRQHAIVSAPVSFTSGARRLQQTKKPGGGWAIKQGTNTDGQYGSRVTDAYKKLHQKACEAKPLMYEVNAGMYFVERMRNMLLPMGTMGEGSGTGDWTSEPVPIFKLGGSNGSQKIEDKLPHSLHSLCTEGACRGMMPTCPGIATDPPYTNLEIIFKLNRTFHWRNYFGPKMRHSIAYGLALLPSAIALSERNIEAQQNATLGAVGPPETSSPPAAEETGVAPAASPSPATSAAANPPPASPPSPAGAAAEVPVASPDPAAAPASPLAASPGPVSGATAPARSTLSMDYSSELQGSGVEPSTALQGMGSDAFENLQPFPFDNQRRKRRLLTEDQPSEDEEGHSGEMHGWFEEEEDPDDEGDKLDKETEFNQFTVKFTKPLPFVLDEKLMRYLVLEGAFRIKDGREAEHGPISISDFKFRERFSESELHGYQARAEALRSYEIRPAEREPQQPAGAAEPVKQQLFATRVSMTQWKPRMAVLSSTVLGSASLGIVVVATVLSFRRRGYAPILPVDLTSSATRTLS